MKTTDKWKEKGTRQTQLSVDGKHKSGEATTAVNMVWHIFVSTICLETRKGGHGNSEHELQVAPSTCVCVSLTRANHKRAIACMEENEDYARSTKRLRFYGQCNNGSLANKMQLTATLHSKLHSNVLKQSINYASVFAPFLDFWHGPGRGLWWACDGSHPCFALVGEICSLTSSTLELFTRTLSCSLIRAGWCVSKRKCA